MNKTEAKEFLIRFDERIRLKAGPDIATKIEKISVDSKSTAETRINFIYAFFIKGIFNAKQYETNLKNAIKSVLENMKDTEKIKIETSTVEGIGEYSRWILEITFFVKKKLQLNKLKFMTHEL